ncbi:Resolvase domain-containing protein [Halococcus saccharolyticus DSM 5350]|uniref:Resolvase domain-containing protein n=1 Tax=Halococcus saccharolyticus DSM 5350 TaxID=1227455 RepID=M0MGS1_9EURY|nr:Resolvase domain-containing protein [Halococcus saccharolyticus DSM 5350]
MPSSVRRGSLHGIHSRRRLWSRSDRTNRGKVKIRGASAIQIILARAEANYDIPFDNDQWRLERAKVDVDGRNSRRSMPRADTHPYRREGQNSSCLLEKAFGASDALDRTDVTIIR